MLGGINRRNQFSSLVVTDEVMLDFSPYYVQACHFLRGTPPKADNRSGFSY
jgi:hypothetical protein